MSNQDQNDQRRILHILPNKFHQRKCFVIVIISKCVINNYPRLPLWRMSQRPLAVLILPYLSSSGIQMAALGRTSTPFCFVIRQFLGFFPGQVHLSKVSFDDIYPILPCSSWLSLVTSQFPVCCLTSCSRVVHSQDVSQPPEPSFLIISSSFLEPFFFLMSSFLTLSLHVIPNSLLWNLWWVASIFFICVTDSGHDSAPYSRVEMSSDS